MSNRTTKQKTSITVDSNVWREFGAELRRIGVDYSEAIDLLARDYLERKRDTPGLTKGFEQLRKTVTELAANKRKSDLTRAEVHRLLDQVIDSGTESLVIIYWAIEMALAAVNSTGQKSLEDMMRIRELEEKARAKTNFQRSRLRSKKDLE